MTTEEFLRRFLAHVLPRGFTRVRHYGCFSPGSVKKLAVARSLLAGLEATAPANETARTPMDVESTEVAIDAIEDEQATAKTSQRRCPFCQKGRMQRIGVIARTPRVRCAQRAPP